MPGQPWDVPREFTRKLTEYDPLLRVRWDSKQEYWRIERKVGRRWAPTPKMESSSPQDWECYKEGHVIVMRVPPWALDNRVFWGLFEGDIQRQGGAKGIAQSMEAYEAFQREKSDARFSDAISQRTKARWDSWNSNYPHHGHAQKGRGHKLG